MSEPVSVTVTGAAGQIGYALPFRVASGQPLGPDTQIHWVSMAVPSDGSYSVDDGIISSVPCTCSNGEWTIVEGLDIDEFSQARIEASVAELREERDAVKQLALV